ncbi:MAG: hypothetical protein R3C05_00700 [Pirellulaceae bacterium]
MIDTQNIPQVINAEGDSINLTLENLTIQNGKTTGSNGIVDSRRETTHSGGGIRFQSSGVLSLTESTLGQQHGRGRCLVAGSLARGNVTLSGSNTLSSSLARRGSCTGASGILPEPAAT